MRIHKEGIATILITFFAIGLILLLINSYFPSQTIFHFIFYFICLIFWSIIILFFRVPKRDIIIDDNKILCPADGKVVVIEEVEEPEYFKDKRIQVSVFMSPLNVHVNWFPMNGIVKYYKYHKGKHLVAFHPKSSTANERSTIVIENNNKSIMVRQIAGAMARRVVCYAKENDKAIQGEQIGIIKSGSRVDIYLPCDAKINVCLNEVVRAKKNIIAILQ